MYKRKEAKVDGLVIDWFANNWHKSVALEVKIKGNKALPHQELALKQVKEGRFKYKIPDMGRVNPFDGFVLVGADAFIVTCEGRKCVVKDMEGRSFKIEV